MTTIDPDRPQDYQTRAGERIIRMVPLPENQDPHKKLLIVAETCVGVNHWYTSTTGRFGAYDHSHLDIIPRPVPEATTSSDCSGQDPGAQP